MCELGPTSANGQQHLKHTARYCRGPCQCRAWLGTGGTQYRGLGPAGRGYPALGPCPGAGAWVPGVGSGQRRGGTGLIFEAKNGFTAVSTAFIAMFLIANYRVGVSTRTKVQHACLLKT